jgi:hypothetical protein
VTEPTRKDRTRPVELLAISGGIGVFVGLIVLMSTRQWVLALIFAGVAFILSLVALAMLALAVRPDGAEKLDLDDQDRSGH